MISELARLRAAEELAQQCVVAFWRELDLPEPPLGTRLMIPFLVSLKKYHKPKGGDAT
jgi:hypothetical protein